MSTVETAFTIQFPVDQTESVLLVFYVAAARELRIFSQYFIFWENNIFCTYTTEGKNENPHFHPAFFCMSGPGVGNRLGHVF